MEKLLSGLWTTVGCLSLSFKKALDVHFPWVWIRENHLVTKQNSCYLKDSHHFNQKRASFILKIGRKCLPLTLKTGDSRVCQSIAIVAFAWHKLNDTRDVFWRFHECCQTECLVFQQYHQLLVCSNNLVNTHSRRYWHWRSAYTVIIGNQSVQPFLNTSPMSDWK